MRLARRFRPIVINKTRRANKKAMAKAIAANKAVLDSLDSKESK